MHNNSNRLTPDKRIQRIELLCYQIFMQMNEGRELHQLLEEHYLIDMPVVDTNYHEHITMAAMREGNNALVRMLKTYAEQYMQRSINDKASEVDNNGTEQYSNATQPFKRPKSVNFEL